MPSAPDCSRTVASTLRHRQQAATPDWQAKVMRLPPIHLGHIRHHPGPWNDGLRPPPKSPVAATNVRLTRSQQTQSIPLVSWRKRRRVQFSGSAGRSSFAIPAESPIWRQKSPIYHTRQRGYWSTYANGGLRSSRRQHHGVPSSAMKPCVGAHTNRPTRKPSLYAPKFWIFAGKAIGRYFPTTSCDTGWVFASRRWASSLSATDARV